MAAPLCTVRLADAGARVIKIERPEGETARHYDSSVEGQSAYFVWLNRGKESAALDLKSAGDLALLHRMLAKADVLVQNLAPGAIDRLGLSAQAIAEKFPRLIAVSIVGYGQDTDYASMRAYDMLVQAESGLCAVTGTPETPSKIGVSAADIGTGMNAHAAILQALLVRGQTGCGRIIEISMFDGMADWMAAPLLHYERAADDRSLRPGACLYLPLSPYTCRDGVAIVIDIQQPSKWKRFCQSVAQRPDLADDMRFSTNPARVANRAALDAEIETIFASMNSVEAIRRLDAAQNAWGRVTGVRDLPDHKALRRIEVALPNGKTVTVPKPSIRSAPFATPPKVPALGADTGRLRAEFST